MSFVVFEGIDGVGKTTQAKLLERYLKDRGIETLRVREPGGTPLGERLREILLDPSLAIDGLTEALLYFASRRELCERVIKEALTRGGFIIAERFTLSTYAYQGYMRGVNFSLLRKLEEEAVDLPVSPLYLVLDLSPRLALSRKKREDRIERESMSFFEDLRDAYLDLARRRNDVLVVDALGPPREVFKRVLEALKGAGIFENR
ncbi:MAG: dTMP kinase [Synergistetes bacterium]|nr:dTMP kinase [Synergistota bacterium]